MNLVAELLVKTVAIVAYFSFDDDVTVAIDVFAGFGKMRITKNIARVNSGDAIVFVVFDGALAKRRKNSAFDDAVMMPYFNIGIRTRVIARVAVGGSGDASKSQTCKTDSSNGVS